MYKLNINTRRAEALIDLSQCHFVSLSLSQSISPFSLSLSPPVGKIFTVRPPNGD